MSTKDNGGPAFPVHDVQAAEPSTVHELRSLARGMTLRDYFAAKAMQAYVSSYPRGEICGADFIAADAYEMADAMLAERSKQ